MAIDSSAGLLFRISGDASGGVAAIDQTLKKIDQLNASSKNIGQALQSVGSSITSIGQSLTIALTAPLAALGTLGVRSALAFDEVRTKINALVGDATQGAKKIDELTKLAERSIGLTRTAALQAFTQLKGIGGIGDEVINKVIVSTSKLNAAFKLQDADYFKRNLVQIFSQGFERADIKEAIGQVPIFEQLLVQAFGTSDGEKLKALKAAGKLTLESYLSGLSDAIEGDPRISGITENLSIQIAKGFEKLNTALAPLGEAILKIIVPAFNALIPYVQQASEWFASLSAPVQTAVIAIAALAAAAGPVLIVVGGLATAIGSVVAVAVPLGIALAAVVGVLLQLGPLLVIVAGQWAALSQAWQRDAGGIRTVTLEVFDSVRTAITTALAAIQKLWQDHGREVMATVSAAWSSIRGIFNTALNVLGGIIRTGLEVLRGNWKGAWDSFLAVIQNTVRVIVEMGKAMGQAMAAALRALIPIITQYGTQIISTMISWATSAVRAVASTFAGLPLMLVYLVPKFVAAGVSIGTAIWRGIQQGLGVGAQAGGTLSFAGGGAGGGFGGVGIPSVGGGGGAGGGGGSGESEADKRQRKEEERFQLVKDRIAAEINLEEAKAARLLALEEYRFARGEINEQELLDFRQATEGKLLQFKRDKLQEEYEQAVRLAKERLRISREIAEFEEKYNAAGLKHAVEQIALENKSYDEQIAHIQQLWEWENKRFNEAQKRIDAEKKHMEEVDAAIRKDLGLRKEKGPDPDEKATPEVDIYDPFSGLIDRFNEFYDLVLERGPTLTETFQSIASIGMEAFGSFANAIGSVVEQWVLYGETGPAVMRKILAAALASLAAEAAVRAIFELALGFASLFFNPAEAAAHFQAAALFGVIAVGAGLAGRAIAGDSFKKQTQTATGGRSGASGGGSPNSGNEGDPYSDKKEITIDAGRNTPFTQRWEGVLRLQVQSNDSHVVKVVEDNVRGNGNLRTVILNTAEGYG